MWNCYGMMGGWGWLNAAFSLMVFALIIGGGIWLVRRLDTGRPTSPAPTAGSAEAILAERYARGEIDDQEYQQRLTVLRSGTPERQ